MKRIYSRIIIPALMLVFILNFISASSSNLISNSGFEDGLNNWEEDKWWYNSYNIGVSDDSLSGNKAAKTSVEGYKNNYECPDCTSVNVNHAVASIRTKEIILKPNTEYEISAWVKVDKQTSENGFHPRIDLYLFKNSADLKRWVDVCYDYNAIHEAKTFSNIPVGEWTKVSLKFKTNNENVYTKIRFMDRVIKPYSGTPTVLWDDVSLIEKSTLPPTQPKAYSESYWECNNGFCQTRNPSTGFNFCWDETNIRTHANYACRDNGGVKTLVVSKECTPTVQYQSICKDSDGRIDLYEKSNYYFGYVKGEEYCWDGIKAVTSGTMVGEVWCENGIAFFDFFKCKNGCENGACKKTADDDDDDDNGDDDDDYIPGECEIGDCEDYSSNNQVRTTILTTSDGEQKTILLDDTGKKNFIFGEDSWNKWFLWVLIALILLIILIVIVAIIKR